MKKTFKPENRQQVYFIEVDLTVTEDVYDSEQYFYVTLSELGLLYETKEEAEDAAEQIRVRIELQRLADAANEEEQAASGEDPTEWDTINNHYFIYYDYEEDSVRVNFEWDQKCDLIYFPSSDAAYAAIDKLGAERILRYYFGIEPEPEEGGADA